MCIKHLYCHNFVVPNKIKFYTFKINVYIINKQKKDQVARKNFQTVSVVREYRKVENRCDTEPTGGRTSSQGCVVIVVIENGHNGRR